MIYLLSQMILCVVLSAIAGGAAGWLLQRARAGREDEALRETIVRQHHQLRHAETDVAMLTDDFDDLKQRSQSELETLRRENRRLPTLVQNLDKSQTLVRQLMQKHEVQLREAAQQSETLRARLAEREGREADLARARSELEDARAELLALRGARAPADVAGAIADAASGAEPTPDAVDADEAVATTSDPSGPASLAPLGIAVGVAAAAPSASAAAEAAEVRPRAAAPARVEPRDVVRTGFEVDVDSLAAPRASAAPVVDGPRDVEARAEPGPDGAATDADAVRADAFRIDAGGYDADDADDPGDDDPDAFDDDEDYDPLDESVELLFEPVDRHDDLQRIFGIGPVTERALNRLGITSYSQLAELQRHEVEQIADALQIYPGRIERDDWVGNARRQLEDVLEEL